MPIVRILLLPFAVVYKLITDIRNHLYNIGRKRSEKFDRFVISVGNLTVGGTGKTPFVELLIREMKNKYRLAVLSRGYKRKTSGFKIAINTDNSETLGDEPFQYYTKFGKEVVIAVGEKRALAIPEIISHDKEIDIIILDDAYQHRSVTPHLNILLNDYNRPFYDDFVLPAGLLRESRKNANRADVIVVTKCPEELENHEMEVIKQRIHKYCRGSKPIFFTGIKYLKPQRLFGSQNFSNDVMLFTGIANSFLLENYIEKNYNLLGHRKFSDHYAFTKKDLSDLIESFEEINCDSKCLLTTEKDMVRILSLKEEARFLHEYPVFYLPIELYFLENGDFFANHLNNELEKGLKDIAIN